VSHKKTGKPSKAQKQAEVVGEDDIDEVEHTQEKKNDLDNEVAVDEEGEQEGLDETPEAQKDDKKQAKSVKKVENKKETKSAAKK
jgi:hypothetical protein